MELIFHALLPVVGLFAGCGLMWFILVGRRRVLVPRRSIREIAADHTTDLPLPPNADSCSHDWDLVTHDVLDGRRSVTVLKCLHCGVLDKTIEDVEPIEACRHRWKKEKDLELESAYEQMATAADKHNRAVFRDVSSRNYNKSVPAAPAWRMPAIEMDEAHKWMFEKKLVQIRICPDCGEIDKTITSNYGKTET